MGRNVDRKERGRKQFDSDIIDKACNGEYVLLLGSEIVVDNDKLPDSYGDSNKILLQNILQTLKEKRGFIDPGIKNFSDFINLTDFKSESLHKFILDEIYNYTFKIEEVSEDLRKLIATKFFRVVLTTTYDPYIEKVMESVWGKKGFRIMDFFNKKGDTNDLPSENTFGDEYYDIQPTLYYLFGKADPENDNKRFAVTDQELMWIITEWLKNPPPNLMSYLQNKRILSIGCNLNDWCFRFFWYAMRNKDENIAKEGDIALLLNLRESVMDLNLHNFLEKSLGLRVTENSRNFLSSLVENLQEDRISDIVQASSSMGGVFISYAHRDYVAALKLFRRLKKEGFNVWLDSPKLYTGSDFNKRIYNAIQQSKIFIPILSPNIADDLKNPPVEEPYYQKEWKWAAADSNDVKILPVMLPGYSLSEDYHKKVTDILNATTIFDWNSQPLSSLVNDIRFNLKKPSL